MVLLTMTPALVAAIEKYQELPASAKVEELSSDQSLSSPSVGKPISHGQILDISTALLLYASSQTDTEIDSYRLNHLLRGSQVYVAPAEPKAEPSSEYKALMAQLRRQEEARTYAKMLNPASRPTNPFTKFTAPNSAAAWDLQSSNDEEADETKFAEVNRQLALIINVLVSIIACSVAVWLITHHWSAPARLALSMLCSLVVGVAEVVIYAGYVRKLGEAKSKEKSKPEKKTIADTWVIEGNKTKRVEESAQRLGDITTSAEPTSQHSARRRKRG